MGNVKKWLSMGMLSVLASAPGYAQDVLSELNQAMGDTTPESEPITKGDWRGFLGVGGVALDHPVVDRQVLPLPLVSVSYRDTLYLRGGTVGAWLFKSDDPRTRFGVSLKGRSGYDPDNDPGLAGMEKRDTSLEAGVNATWRTQPVNVSLGLYTDVSDRSNGSSATLGFSHAFRLSEKWSLTPSVGVEWLSEQVVDYYYGVRPAEALPGRPAYAGVSTINVRGALLAHYRLARSWSLFGGVSYTHLGSGITDSPIILRDSVAAVVVGGGWHF